MMVENCWNREISCEIKIGNMTLHEGVKEDPILNTGVDIGVDGDYSTRAGMDHWWNSIGIC